MAPLLELNEVVAGYGPIRALHSVSLTVEEGAIAAVLGVLTGLIVGRFKRAAEALLPPLELLRPIPAVAWIPIAISSSDSARPFVRRPSARPAGGRRGRRRCSDRGSQRRGCVFATSWASVAGRGCAHR